MSSFDDKPFYFKPPWNVLFELTKLKRTRLWDVDVSFLLTSFLDKMSEDGSIDFRASGVALGSSATIYLMKSKLLLKLEEPPPTPKPKPGFLPPPLFQPLRHELTSTTITHLLEALDGALKGERIFNLKPRLEPVLPPPPQIIPHLDLYLMEIDKQMKRLYRSLMQISRDTNLIPFSKVIAALEKLESIKTFIVLLFLAKTGKVNLWQNEDCGDILITVC
jgi:chromatin segregation and condensation protein Rec8/ScpA/Scc1 (kleisin family)